MATITGFHHVAIHSADFDRSTGFYKDILGLRDHMVWGDAPHRAIMLHAGDGRPLEIFEKSSPAAAEPGPLLHFALRTDDCATMLEKVRAAGMKVTMETADIPVASTQGIREVRIAFFEGPDGEIVELFQSEAV